MKTPPNRTATDDEIEAEVLAKRSTPEAWETLAFVPPSRSPRPAWMLRARHLESDANGDEQALREGKP
ncbi:MAG TPA: hypothetical protein VF618_20265 [Thermoanaerobaculia bacterium]